MQRPLLSEHDHATASEGSLDSMGLYPISNELGEKMKEYRLGMTVKEEIVEDVTIDAEWFKGI